MPRGRFASERLSGKMTNTRRQFLMGSASVAAAIAIPAPFLAQPSPAFFGIDFGAMPPSTLILRYWWDAEQDIMRFTGIDALDIYEQFDA